MAKVKIKEKNKAKRNTQFNVNVSKKVVKEFREFCEKKGYTQGKILENLMKTFVESC